MNMSMADGSFLDVLAGYVEQRSLPEGGFAGRPGGAHRPDATAWAILALRSLGSDRVRIDRARSRLVADQLPDGRVCISPEHAEAFWPTPLAVLAWKGSASHSEAQSRSIGFLLKTFGHHWVKKPGSPYGHDPSIRGWSWTANTHSWIEPTALAMIALDATGHSRHERVEEGVRMLLDRMPSRGGWNVGNTTVYGRELRPMPDATGIALQALAGHVSRERVRSSLDYLRSVAPRLRSPLSLAWTVLGLSAWGERPPEAERRVRDALAAQRDPPRCDTSDLALLLIALMPGGGLTELLRKEA